MCHDSCLVARNLLNGMKTCWEVFQYMNCSESNLFCQAGDGANSLVEGYSKVDLIGTIVSALLWLSVSGLGPSQA